MNSRSMQQPGMGRLSVDRAHAIRTRQWMATAIRPCKQASGFRQRAIRQVSCSSGVLGLGATRGGDAWALQPGGRRFAWRARSLGLPFGRLVLDERVDLAAEDEDEARDVKPGHEDDHAADRAVGLVVAAEV